MGQFGLTQSDYHFKRLSWLLCEQTTERGGGSRDNQEATGISRREGVAAVTAVGSSWTCSGLDVGSERVKGESLFLPQQLENGGRSLCTGSISPAAGAPSCRVFQGWADEEGTVREAEKEQPVKWENRGCRAEWRKRFWQRVCTSNAPDGQTRPSRKVKQENGPLDLALQVIGDLGKGTFDRPVRKKA